MTRTAMSLACALCLDLPAPGAHAQTDTRNPVPPVLEEVLVTAQKREQTLQDVPISISVATAQDMANINAFTFDDLEQLTPGVSLFGGLQSASIRLRGVGPGYFAVNSPQSVVVFIDQFAQAQIGSVFSTLVDIERLELLRGPQGTLYGINAPGGAYNITTRAPAFDRVGGYLEGSYSQYDSSQLNAEDLRGAVNLPLLDDTLALRLAGVYRNDNGYIRNVNPASPDNTNGGANTEAVRARTRWLISDTMQLDATANYQDLSQQISSFAYQGLLPGTGAGTAYPAIYTTFKDREDFGDFAGHVDGKVKDISAHWRWEADFSNVDFLALYQEFDNASRENRKPFPGSSEVFGIALDYRITTYELRFSDVVEDISYVAGLYHFDRPADGTFNVLLSGIDVVGDSTGKDTGSAAYGNVSYRFTEQWELGLGARYDDIDTRLNNDIRFLEYVALIDDKLGFNHLSWSVKLNHYFSDNLTFYAAVDNAFKQGGFNPLLPGAYPLEQFFPATVAIARELALYDDETSTSFEIGVKGIALDDTLRYTFNVFYQQFQDHQIGLPGDVAALDPLSGLFNSQLANADEVYTQGIEFDATYLFTAHWELALRGAYADPTIDQWNTRLCAAGEEPPLQPGQAPIPGQLYCPKNGEALTTLPRWQTNVQLGYEHPLGGGWDIAARANWNWQSRPARQTLADTRKPNVPDVSDFDEPKNRLDLSLSFIELDRGVEFKVWAKNITDEDLNIDPTQYEDTQTLVGLQYPGREYGVTASYTF